MMKSGWWGVALTPIVILAFLAGMVVGFKVRELFAYDSCLDRINYDEALYHLCDDKQPAASPSRPGLN